jgi:uncharacterized protein YcnI
MWSEHLRTHMKGPPVNRKASRITGTAAAAALATAIVALTGTPAAAHVTVTPSTTVAGAYTVLTVSVPHGCDGSGTTKVAIQIPKEIVSVTPTVNPNWTVEKVMADLNPPVKDSHGNEITKRVDQVVYTAKAPLADDLRDVFQLSLKLPDKAGLTLVFPAIQTCEVGQTGWTQVAAEGQKADELEHPAPLFKTTEKPAAANPAPVANTGTTTTTATDAGASTPALTWVALVVGVLGLLVGGFALLRPRPKS